MFKSWEVVFIENQQSPMHTCPPLLASDVIQGNGKFQYSLAPVTSLFLSTVKSIGATGQKCLGQEHDKKSGPEIDLPSS